MLKRGIYYCHRDLDRILDCVEKGKPFYLYTGRGPSSGAMHVGHLVPFRFTLFLQKAFNAPLVIQITDDEKYIWKNKQIGQQKGFKDKLSYFYHLARENSKDIIAFGFDPEKTFIFIDTDIMGGNFYKNVIKVQEMVTVNTINKIFGFKAGDPVNCGQIAYPAIQAVPSFSSSFPDEIFGGKQLPCLIPCALDQDPYFRMTRDVAHRLGEMKPSCLYAKFIPGLNGPKGKMSSSSSTEGTLFLTDTAKQIKKKINKSFSGGGATLAEHREFGAKLDQDVAFQYLTFFLENDEKLSEIAHRYSKGEMLTGEVKRVCIDTMTPILMDFQERRKTITDAMLDKFMTVRELQLPEYTAVTKSES